MTGCHHALARAPLILPMDINLPGCNSISQLERQQLGVGYQTAAKMILAKYVNARL